MKRIGAGIAVIVVALTLVTPPAASQNGSVWLTPKSPETLESAGEVVLTISLWRAGRVTYRTYDGACVVTYSRGGSAPDTTCSNKKARAPEDYTATSGELVFTEVEGSKTITIPIVDDDLAEGDVAFTLAAWEEVNADPWIDRGDSVVVRIVDDETGNTGEEEPAAPAAVSTSDTAPAGRQSSGSALGAPATSTTATPPSRDLQLVLPAGELRPGPGFELTAGGRPERAPARGGRGGGSGSASGFGLGVAALAVGGLAWGQRQRRWSSTQA